MSFDLKLHAYRLLMDEPFFAALSRKIEKRASTAIPTAGVRVCPDTAQFEMIYNPEFFARRACSWSTQARVLPPDLRTRYQP